MKKLIFIVFYLYFIFFSYIKAQNILKDSVGTNTQTNEIIEKKIDNIYNKVVENTVILKKFENTVFYLLIFNFFLLTIFIFSLILIITKLSKFRTNIDKLININNYNFNYIINQIQSIHKKADNINKNLTPFLLDHHKNNLNKKNNDLDNSKLSDQNILKSYKGDVELNKKTGEKKNNMLQNNIFPVKANPMTLIVQYSNRKSDFYIKKSYQGFEMYVEQEILNSKPDPKYEDLLNPFFQLVYAHQGSNLNHYRLILPAKVTWDEISKKGKIVEKGKIER